MSVSDQPSTRSGRDPQEAEQQIATQGDEIDKEALRELLAEEASRPVPAGSPAKWRERAESLLDDIGSCFDDAGPSHEVYLLKAHLAAMPQPEPDAELLGALEAAATVLETLSQPGNKVLSGGVRDAIARHAKAARAAMPQAEQGAAG